MRTPPKKEERAFVFKRRQELYLGISGSENFSAALSMYTSVQIMQVLGAVLKIPNLSSELNLRLYKAVLQLVYTTSSLKLQSSASGENTKEKEALSLTERCISLLSEAKEACDDDHALVDLKDALVRDMKAFAVSASSKKKSLK